MNTPKITHDPNVPIPHEFTPNSTECFAVFIWAKGRVRGIFHAAVLTNEEARPVAVQLQRWKLDFDAALKGKPNLEDLGTHDVSNTTPLFKQFSRIFLDDGKLNVVDTMGQGSDVLMIASSIDDAVAERFASIKPEMLKDIDLNTIFGVELAKSVTNLGLRMGIVYNPHLTALVELPSSTKG